MISAPRKPVDGKPAPVKSATAKPALVAPNQKRNIKIQTTKKSRKSAPVPEKLTTYQRARAAALRLVLWVLVPLLLLSLIVWTIWSHDPELEDCLEDPRAQGPVNCPMVCYKDSSLYYYGSVGSLQRCSRSTTMYVVPLLGLRLGVVEAFLLCYMMALVMSSLWHNKIALPEGEATI